MQILRNEVRTGLLVILTLGLVVGIVLYISSPGLFRPQKKFLVYFDNAAGVKPGAAVMLAGRKIGTVADIQSPVPLNDRPEHSPTTRRWFEFRSLRIRRFTKRRPSRCEVSGLLAELVIDFTNGNPDLRLGRTEWQIRRHALT